MGIVAYGIKMTAAVVAASVAASRLARRRLEKEVRMGIGAAHGTTGGNARRIVQDRVAGNAAS
jgi:hypothetical protein